MYSYNIATSYIMDEHFYYHREEIQIVFKTDPNLKEKTLEKAKSEGVTLKAILTMAMRAYVNDDLIVGMRHKEALRATDLPPEDDVPRRVKVKVRSPIKEIRNSDTEIH